ncbi:hypothetical protein KRP22_014927 [Phytophthora ramorum]|uniref:uncharacterized protein n=1 Tax=Phytophthora ramorum TaxID=164328 RepID=UPI0030A4051B|nr:hypothetical protein KRP23_11901 [Phytophthora ramorum]KAH7496123.1 hypothetical protein KRP22_14017 [Phytophthora ramorum]
MNASYSSSGSSPSIGDDVGEDSTAVSKTVGTNTADSCTWYANASCKRPRTCYDCLNVQISSECAIMPNGMCVSLAEYSHFLTKQQEFGIYYKYYPTNKYTYCSADDTACTACTSTWLSDYKRTGSIDKPALCTGTDGCICLARCALPDWSASILADQCSSSGSIDSKSGTSTASRIGFALAVGVAFGALLGLWCIKLLVRQRGVGRGRGSSVPAARETWTVSRRPRTGPQLALTGWKELREKLIAFEQEAFGGGESAVLGSQEHSGATTDAQDEALEGGGDYQPLSPNSDVAPLH